ncbi:MAG: hypothetical protein ACI9Y1_002442 [Lentisphaeria bacterium]|jgi:hypothetical protein
MKAFILGHRKSIIDTRYNPLRYVHMASQHYSTQGLAWMWGTILSLSLLSIFQLQIVWLAQLLVLAGVFASIPVFKHGEPRSTLKAPVQNLSHASVCVWQLDLEA